MTVFCSLDIETTGLDAEHSDIIEIGAVIDMIPSSLADGDRPEFHCYIKEDLYTGEPQALAMHAEIFKRIASTKKPHLYFSKAEAVFQLSTWLVENWKQYSDGPVLFAGKNFGSFDLPFLRKLPAFNESITYRHACLDPGVLYLDPSTDVSVPGTKECCKRAGIKFSGTHTALEDALQVSRLIIAYFNKKTHRGWVWPQRQS